MPGPFERDGIWLRCALHTHTSVSDGELTPDLLVHHYDWAGFDVLFLTDHWARTVARSTRRLLVAPGCELNATLPGSTLDAHVLALGVEAEPERPEQAFSDLPETVAWVVANGGLPYLAHPYWSGLRTADFEECEDLAGLEVYNAGCDLEIGRGLASVHWDEALGGGRLLNGIATDDSHHPGFDSAFAWVDARCSERTADAVLEALRDGAFYSSTGPRIDALSLGDDAVELRCTPARSITLLAGRGGARANAGRLGYPHRAEILETNQRGEIVAVRLERPPRSRYGRVEIEGAAGGTAWTNALWFAPS